MPKTKLTDEIDESTSEEEAEISTLFDEIQRALERQDAADDGNDELGAGNGSEAFAQFTLRVPRSVQQELHAMADDHEMSVALLMNCLIDAYLLNQSGRGYGALAPWYLRKVLRHPR